MNEGAKKEARPCVMLNVTNHAVDYFDYSATRRLASTITKFAYEIRKVENALLSKLNARRIELRLKAAPLDLNLMSVRPCLIRQNRVKKPRSNKDMEGPPPPPPPIKL